MHGVAAVAGVAVSSVVYETGEHGGELVYSYAGGVGMRTAIRRTSSACCWPATTIRRWRIARPAAPTRPARSSRRRRTFSVRPRSADAGGRIADAGPEGSAGGLDALAAIQVPADNRFMAFQRADCRPTPTRRRPQGGGCRGIEAVLKDIP